MKRLNRKQSALTVKTIVKKKRTNKEEKSNCKISNVRFNFIIWTRIKNIIQ